jgi:lambda repressor-like predicted transcriptional regulator
MQKEKLVLPRNIFQSLKVPLLRPRNFLREIIANAIDATQKMLLWPRRRV